MKKYRLRMFVYVIIFICSLGILSLSCYNSWAKILENKKIKSELEEKYNKLVSKEENLEKEVIKLQDSEYAAKYARERFLYSKDGELIIKLPDENWKTN